MKSGRHVQADIQADVDEKVDAGSDLSRIEDSSIPQNDHTPASLPCRGRWTALRSDCLSLAVLVVCMLIFLVAAKYWGPELWDAIDGYHPEKNVISLPSDAPDHCCEF
jgi:hypothetical protein